MSLLDIQKISCRIKGKVLIENISTSFRPGFLYMIIGPNGSGKSTLLKNLCGIWTPTQGQVIWNQQPLNQLSSKERSKLISLVPQTPSYQVDFNVSGMVGMGCYAYSYQEKEEMIIIEQSLKAVDAWHLKDRPFTQLSGGERQRVYIARSLATQAPILLLDEPTTHLDIKHQLEVWELLKYLVGQGKIIIVATHDIWAVEKFSNHILMIDKGKKIAEGTSESILQSSLMKEFFGIAFQNYH